MGNDLYPRFLTEEQGLRILNLLFEILMVAAEKDEYRYGDTLTIENEIEKFKEELA